MDTLSARTLDTLSLNFRLRDVPTVAARQWLGQVVRVSSPESIVDDHPSFRSSAQAILEAEGFAVLGEA